MYSEKIKAGAAFPEFTVPLVEGGEIKVGGSNDEGRWKLVVIYRGLHCPLCAQYLEKLQSLKEDFLIQETDIIAISGDGLEKAKSQVAKGSLEIPIGYDLPISVMEKLGLYISNPRSPEETDRPFPEPGLFLIRPDGNVQIVDISNAPFSRPDLAMILRGSTFAREKNYPIRGTYS
ncbi:peroxiredoxin-like family protein [Sneathiella sp. P13V-1]|uniref:peroxiredoxin-like family protein n=1 Tax=Sneathiella sp. P13V-1 TaxID=2697366 RepID=UPI002AB03DA4|nr:peroxiredoxin-like family protein [Sneathiella sp. P13V-1]